MTTPDATSAPGETTSAEAAGPPKATGAAGRPGPPDTAGAAASAPGPAQPPDLDAQLRDLAVKRLKKHQDFHAHAVVYVVVNGFLWALWLVISLTSGWHFPWPVFPLLGWGIGLALNAWDVYWRREITPADVEREVERLRGG